MTDEWLVIGKWKQYYEEHLNGAEVKWSTTIQRMININLLHCCMKPQGVIQQLQELPRTPRDGTKYM